MVDTADLIRALVSRGETVAAAESLTGGLVTAQLVQVPGASAAVRGGIVTYASDLKASLLGVDADLLASGGAVQSEVARQMAVGVRRVLGASYGLGTTGVAGPTEQDGQPVGRVFVAVAGPDRTLVQQLDLPGDRDAVRRTCVSAVLQLLEQLVTAAGELD